MRTSQTTSPSLLSPPASSSRFCDLCDELAGGRANAFWSLYDGAPADRTVLRTGTFSVLPSIGQLVEGYLLVVPRAHVRALSQLDGDALAELERLKATLSARLLPLYGAPIFFEHGACTGETPRCGTDHAHMHVVPFGRPVDFADTLREDFPGTQLSRLSDIRQVAEQWPVYLLYQAQGGPLWVFDAKQMPSQHLRKLVAAECGNGDWDWHNYGREPRLIRTIESVRAVLGGMSHEVP